MTHWTTTAKQQPAVKKMDVDSAHKLAQTVTLLTGTWF
jgi:hypothetical protein